MLQVLTPSVQQLQVWSASHTVINLKIREKLYLFIV